MTAPGSAFDTAPAAPPLDELGETAPVSTGASLEQLFDVTLPVIIEFGRTTMTVQEILDLGAGSVVQLERMVGEPIDIFVGDRHLAEGEVVVLGEHFGVRVTRILGGTRENSARGNGRS